MENSFWILNNESEDYSALDKSIDAEYLIVGAGLTGLHTAYLLSDISSNIVIVDANKVGSGSSGRNTGKVTSSHGLIYDYISQKYGDKSSKLYYEANEEGLRLIKDIVQKYNIDCNFETVPNYIFTTEDEGLEEIKKEYRKIETIGKINKTLRRASESKISELSSELRDILSTLEVPTEESINNRLYAIAEFKLREIKNRLDYKITYLENIVEEMA